MLAPLGEKETSPLSEDWSKVLKRKALKLPATYVCMFRKCCKKTTLQIHGSEPTLMDLPKKPPQMEEEAWPNGLSQRMSIPTGKYSSNYRAESEALIEAVTALRNHRDTYDSKVVLLTDAKSVLQALENSKKTDHNNLKKALMDLQTSAQEVVLQWIPGHCNIFGNEVADELAKKGSELEQIHQDLNLNETKTIINATIDKRWKETHPQYDKKDHICNLSHADQVTIFRLRCGHNRLRCHMFNCFKVGETARCECGADKQDAQHILQDCILYSHQRSAIWPT